ncbi:MAG: MraY family glycosyltransferase [Bryobacter sp.]|nr:MraY family glycosyltransferase [Bryobacter sp.]
MKSLLALFAVACVSGLGTNAFFHWLYRRLGKFDLPDADRKFHAKPIPRSGGVAIFAAFAISLALFQLLPAGGNVVLGKYSGFLVRLIPATTVMLLTGLLDDWLDLRPKYKLLGQMIAASLAYWAGIAILPLPGEMAWLNFLLTVGWLVLSANAFNLIDGTDGLAGSLGLLASLGLITVALVLDYYALALLFAPLAGAILPFLRRNWPPADVFMGDCGSLTIGFLIGCGGAALSRRYEDGSGLLAALLLLALPLLEVAVSMTRRTLRGRSIFAADSQHLHHQLKRQGLSSLQLLLHLGIFSALAVILATGVFFLGAPERILLLGCFGVLFWSELLALPYTEFKVLNRALWGGGIQRWIRQRIELDHLRKDLQAAQNYDELWRLIRSAAFQLGCHEVQAKFGLRIWHDQLADSPRSEGWQIRVNLADGNWVNINVDGSRSSRLEDASSELAAVIRHSLTAARLQRLLAKSRPPARQSPPEVLLLDQSA